MRTRVRSSNGSPHLVVAAVAMALGSGVAGPGFAAESQAEAQEELQELTEVVVTGSRIVRRDYESQSPIVTIQAETFENRASVGLEDALNQLPQFTVAGSAQANSSASTPFPSPTAAPGAATVNLRNLGTNRSLVLVDGRRVQPVNGNLVVDLNTIPSTAIQSVEVITGGAAAVYGADAISGVVNLILKKNFEGAQFDAQYGITQEGDGEEAQFSGLLGANYSDGRGNVLFGATFSDRQIIRTKDRDWARAGWADPGTNVGGVPGVSNLSAINCGAACASTFPLLSGNNYMIDQNGNIFDPNDPLNPAHPYTGLLGGTSGYKVNPNGTLGYFDRDVGALNLPMRRWSMFASTNFKLRDKLTFFTEARFSETFTRAYGTRIGLFNIWDIEVPYNQAYDDPDSPTFGQGPVGFAHHPVSRPLADMLNARVLPGGADPLTSSWLYEGAVDWLPPYTTDTTSNVFQLIAGLRGSLPIKDWSWEAYGSHGKSSVNAHLPESFLNHRQVQQLFSAPYYGRNWTNPEIVGVAGACTSGLPIFNDDGTVNNTPTVSDDCANYVTLRMNNISEIEQEVAEANIQGTLFDIWGGPLQFATGVNFRQEVFKFTPDGAYNANQINPNVVNNIALPVGVKGTTSVKEAYVEFAVPLLADLPLVRKLSIDPGFRYSDYNTAGGETTWKLMGDWQVTDWVRFRGGFQRANRAPNITELFSPIGASSIDFNAPDPCANLPGTPTWGNSPDNPNRLNLQTLCQHLMVRDGAPPSLYEPGQPSADTYAFNVFGGTFPFPFNLAIQGGNPDLNSEKADTVTVGTVLRSPFRVEALRRLSLAVDWYSIDIKGAIAVPSALTVYQQCADYQYNTLLAEAPGSVTGAEIAANSPYCALIQREYLPPQFVWGANRKFKAAYVNLGGIKTSGVDVQLDWGSDLSALGMSSLPGALNLNVQYSKLNSYKQSPFPGGVYVEGKGTGVNFDYQMFSTLSYANGPFSVGLRWQNMPSLDPASGSSTDALGIRSHDQLDLFTRWSMGRYQFRAGIDNLLNADPEVVGATFDEDSPSTSNNALGSSFSSHDTFGRRFYIGVRVTL